MSQHDNYYCPKCQIVLQMERHRDFIQYRCPKCHKIYMGKHVTARSEA